ncbi:MAG: hypothetical protein EZS28_039067, partial [Streblomastix strix]
LPAIRAWNDANVSIDKNTILENNGLRNMNTLSSMQMNVVCEGGISTTTINVAFDNIASLLQSGNGWTFYLLVSSCDVKATYKGESAQPRLHPYIYSASVTIHNTNQKVDITVEGKFLELGMRRLILEIHEKDIDDLGVKQDYNVENIPNTAN